MVRHFLAFRMCGTFSWPPLPGAGPSSAAGAVEVLFVPQESRADFLVAGRWIPKTSPATEAPSPDGADEFGPPLDTLTEEQLRDTVADGSRPFSWMGAPSRGARLRFAAGTLFEQFRAPGALAAGTPPGSGPRLDIHVPLLPDLSFIEFGRPGHAGITVGLGIPLGLGPPLAIRAICSGRSLSPPTGLVAEGWTACFDTLTAGGSDALVDPGTRFGIRDVIFAQGATAAPPYKALPNGPFWLADRSVGPLLDQLRLSAPPRLPASLHLDADGGSFLVPPSAGLWTDAGSSRVRMLRRLCLSVTGRDVPADAGHDLRVRAGALELRRCPGRDEWIRMGKRVNVLADLESQVPNDNDDVWPLDHILTRRVKLAWVAGGRAMPGSVDKGWPATLGIIRQRTRNALAGLRILEGAQPASLLPLVETDAPIGGLALAVTVGEDEVTPLTASTALARDRHALPCTLLSETDVPSRDGAAPGLGDRTRPPRLVLRFPNFETAVSEKDLTGFQVELLPDQTLAAAGSQGGRMTFGVAIRPWNEPTRPAATMKLGIIAGLAFGEAALVGRQPGTDERLSSLRLLTSDVPGADLELQLEIRFDVRTVTPTGVDRAWGDRSHRPMPMIFDEAVAADGGSGSYRLIGTETLAPGQDRHLSATLREQMEAGEVSGSSVLISLAPFALRRSIAAPLSARGDAASADAATYDSDTRQWRVRASDAPYRYVLPPQAIGEGMSKPRRVEIHDAPPGLDGSGAERRQAVDFRLTPPAELWIRASDVQRSFLLPEWAASDIFRQRGEFGLGAALAGLRAEFEYGLAFGLDPSRETGPSRMARVAEVEALVGRPLRGGGDARWSQLLAAYESRPERLEIWAMDPDSVTPFASARFLTARMVLRHTALHRHPISDAPAPDLPRLRGPRFHVSGLAGGALWPIESRAVLAMVLSSPEASDGTLERLALSPLGGDANQTARFANNRVAITSEVRGGYKQYHKVEVTGRIAVLWNRAKHVIVYERTTSDSAQFAPTEENAKTATRRPVLRKVSEYIEVLQAERRFPDMPGAGRDTNVMLAAVRFAGRIIHVDSEWSIDVEDGNPVGYMIPLWNMYAARVRPQVYPQPDVAFVCHAEGAAELPECAQECLNPDNLFFFADTTPGQADDTDLWPARLGIDAARHQAPRPDTTATTASREIRASELRVPRGMRTFTWLLAPPSARPVINAGRADKPVYAALESITFARGVGASDPDGAFGKVAEYERELPDAPFIGVWSKDGTPISGPERAYLPDLAAAMRRVGAALNPTGPTTALSNDLRPALDALRTQLPVPAGKFDALLAAEKKAHNLVAALKLDGTSTCRQMREDLVAKVDARALSLRQEVRAREASLLRTLDGGGTAADRIVAAFKNNSALETELTSALTELVTPALRGATGEVGRLQGGIERARATISAIGAEGRNTIALLKGRTLAVSQAVETGKPWSEQRMLRFQQQVSTELDRGRERFAASLADARRRLSTELDQLGKLVANAALQVVSLLDGFGRRLDSTLLPGFQDLLGRLETVDGEYRRCLDLVEAAMTAVDEINPAENPRIAEFVATARRLLGPVRDGLKDGKERLQRFIARLRVFELELERPVFLDELPSLAERALSHSRDLIAALDGVAGGLEAGLSARLGAAFTALGITIDASVEQVVAAVRGTGDAAWRWAAFVTDQQVAAAETILQDLDAAVPDASARFDAAAKTILDGLKKSVLDPMQPDAFAGTLVHTLLDLPPVMAARARAVGAVAAAEPRRATAAAGEAVRLLADELDRSLDHLGTAVLGKFGATLDKACEGIETAVDTAVSELDKVAARFTPVIDGLLNDMQRLEEFRRQFGQFEGEAIKFGNELAQAAHGIRNTGDQVLDAVAEIGKGKADAPGKILRALAAVGSGPELPSLDFAAERIGYFYHDIVGNVVQTTRIEAWFGRIGDGLKAMGINLEVNGISDILLAAPLDGVAFSRAIHHFAGCDLGRLCSGMTLRKSALDGIRITHDFDRKTFRAWVQVDLEIDMPGRNTMVSFGPFTLDAVNARFSGLVRLEASKDTDTVEQTGRAALTADLDVVVGGQSMVTLRDVCISYGRSGGLHVDFDPKKLTLNPSFQFIQNTLQTVFGDEFGGFEIIKNSGVPVGLRHSFAMPPLSLTYGTSGVQNLQLSNRFELTAFPDFLIANRFALARQELPFTFTIFIIGGSGWLTVDMEYRPFQGRGDLMVVVEAAAGGAGSLAFAFAGVTGSVLITVSVALSYRKLIGQSGGGLTVSLVVVITGVVDVLSIVSALITVALRLSYRDNGDIEALGSFRVTVRITRFFKVRAEGEAHYRMSGGRTQSGASGSITTSVSSTDMDLAVRKAERLLRKGKPA